MMSKFQRSALISVVCLVSVVLYSWIGFSQVPQPSVRLTTSPTISQLKPFEAEATVQSPAQLTLQAIDAAGQLLKDAKMHLKILTQPKNPWFTTDFPIVEGTTLLEMKALTANGELQIQQMLPIRGTYQLLVDVTSIVPNAFAPVQQTLTLSISENWIKYRNLGILATILLLAGLGGGWVIGSRQKIETGEIVSDQVRLLLSGAIVVAIAVLLFVNVSAELAQSHSSTAMSHMTADLPRPSHPSKTQSQGIEMQILGDTDAIVGQLASLQVSAIDIKTQQPLTNVLFKITTTQLENNWVSFAYQGIPDSAGKLAWQQQFFDGAPHSVEVEVVPQANAENQFQPFQVAQNIAVEGVVPPLFVRLISLAYFTGIVGVGLLLGLLLQRRRFQQTRLS